MGFELTGKSASASSVVGFMRDSLSDRGGGSPGTGLPSPLRHFTLKPYAPCVRCPSVATATHFTV